MFGQTRNLVKTQETVWEGHSESQAPPTRIFSATLAITF
jgi:hypothetical protein